LNMSSPAEDGEAKVKEEEKLGQEEEKPTLNQFEIGKMLGQGSYSQVFLATRYCDRKQYALKVVEKRRVARNNMFLYVLQEKKAMLMCDHPGVIKLRWTFRDLTCVYLMMELGEGGELWSLLEKVEKKILPLPLVKHYIAELIVTLEYLHSMKLCHRDLKPENIMLTTDGHLKLTDFGTSKILGDVNPNDLNKDGGKGANYNMPKDERSPDNPSGTNPIPTNSSDEDSSDEEAPTPEQARKRRKMSFVGTPEYMPPEVIHNWPTKGTLSDMWALGIVLFQMLAGKLPFKAGSAYLIFQKTLEGKIDWPADFDPEARDLVENLIQPEPKNRLGAPERGGFPALKAHPFLKDINFDTVFIDPVPSYPPPLKADDSTEEDVTRVEDLDKELEELGFSQIEEGKFVSVDDKVPEGEQLAGTLGVAPAGYNLNEMD